MQIIPVIDLRRGVAVHAIAGNRNDYRPIQTPDVQLGDLDSLVSFYARRNPPAIYVADLDAICDGNSQRSAWRMIEQRANRPIWVDAGVESERDVEEFVDFCRNSSHEHRLVIGTETLIGPQVVEPIVQRLGARRFVLSIDRREGRPLASRPHSLREVDYLRAAESAGVKDVIALDIAAVGVGRAPELLASWRPLMQQFPKLHWRLGGGVKSKSALLLAEQAGFCGVLSATAILAGAL